MVREEIKTGKVGPHAIEANGTVQIWAKAKSPNHRLAMVPIAGNTNEVLYVWPFNSFGDLEKATANLNKIGDTHSVDFDRLSALNKGDDYHSSQRDMIATFRDDLSYGAQHDIRQMRYVRTQFIRIKPGTARDWEESRKILKAAHEKAKINESMLVYQITGGMQSGTYIVFIPWKSLEEMASIPHGKEYWDGMGEDNRKKMDRLSSESVLFDDLVIYAFDPQLSYAPAEFAAADPFWKFKPMGVQPAPIAKKVAKR
jgi:hypothetical protein